ncbi:hypothetical protein HY407_01835 [Candidatus Gottesmanbacteria bacterium]|nr:hypothetical protein [Candidatus Gottesmanbacteria bacterium]
MRPPWESEISFSVRLSTDFPGIKRFWTSLPAGRQARMTRFLPQKVRLKI